MPLYRDKTTRVVTELPESIFEHPVLGRDLEPYLPDEGTNAEEIAASSERPAKPPTLTAKKDKD